jgi:hypothetical protein
MRVSFVGSTWSCAATELAATVEKEQTLRKSASSMEEGSSLSSAIEALPELLQQKGRLENHTR